MTRVPFAIALLASASFQVAAADSCAVRSGAAVVPLVELYTSEGCSSCPPADKWFSRSLSHDNANWLAFHVDYWDDIGWPDRFGSAAYSARQRDRVSAATGGTTVYTPQVMVGEDVQTQWRSDGSFDGELRKARRAPGAGLALQLAPSPGGTRVQLGATPSDAGTAGAKVWLAQYVDNQTTQVKAGENRGVTLHHDRVVRHLWGPWPLGGKGVSQSQALTPLAGQWGLVAFVQDSRGRTLQSLALPASDCAVAKAN